MEEGRENRQWGTILEQIMAMEMTAGELSCKLHDRPLQHQCWVTVANANSQPFDLVVWAICGCQWDRVKSVGQGEQWHFIHYNESVSKLIYNYEPWQNSKSQIILSCSIDINIPNCILLNIWKKRKMLYILWFDQCR